MKISAVVFDFGGVMTSVTMPERVHKCVDELGISWKSLTDGFARYRRLMDGGYITLSEMYDLIWADANISISKEIQERILKEDTASFVYRNELTLKWMCKLRADGYRIGILTNMPASFAPIFREKFADFIETADAMVISGEEHMFKPQLRIYDLLRERIGLPAEELCFIDDVEDNCNGARQAGWQALRFEDNSQIERDFAALIG